MAKTKQTQYTLYLERETAASFDKLVADTKIAKSVLFREAVQDLLAKHKVKVRKTKAARGKT
jgi:hypothetical protein